MCLYRGARASNGSDAAETSLSVLVRWAALNKLTLTALVASRAVRSKCLLQATSGLQPVSNYTRKEGLGPRSTICQTTSAETSA